MSHATAGRVSVDVAVRSIRLRILKGVPTRAQFTQGRGCSSLDPIADTESCLDRVVPPNLHSCSSLDPIADTESTICALTFSILFCCSSLDPIADTERPT